MVQVKLTASYVSRADLRRAAIHLLQSMLALPLHFANMPIKVPSQPTGTRYHHSTNNATLWFGSTGYKKRPDYLATFCLYPYLCSSSTVVRVCFCCFTPWIWICIMQIRYHRAYPIEDADPDRKKITCLVNFAWILEC